VAGGRDDRGQTTVEWLGLILLVLLVVLAIAGLAGLRVAGLSLAQAVVSKIACAIELSDSCETESDLVSAYGLEVASLVGDHAPELLYEQGMRALPVDFRSCRAPKCAGAAARGRASSSSTGEPIVAFVRVVDCRRGRAAETEAAGADCSGSRAGNLYLQYWFYYPDSATGRGVPVVGANGYHLDDWESYQVRIEPDVAFSRASSHHGYNYEFGAANWASDAGIGPLEDAAEAVGVREEGGWGPETAQLHISGGSHAGNARRDDYEPGRTTSAGDLLLIPIEPVAREHGDADFAITPPWRKPVYTDPESEET
jgi:hypothetical protein